MTDYLLRTMDVLRSMIITVSETGSEGEPPEGNAELIKKLNELSEGVAAGNEKQNETTASNLAADSNNNNKVLESPAKEVSNTS